MTKIEWVRNRDGTQGRSWNVTLGCDKISAGCKNCYAIRFAYRMARHPNPKISGPYQGLTDKRGGKLNWTGELAFVEDRLDLPLKRKKPTRWFVDSMSDLGHPAIGDDHLGRLWARMAVCPDHDFLILTKRPAAMRVWLAKRLAWWYADQHLPADLVDRAVAIWAERGFGDMPHPLPNVWLGTSVEDRASAEARLTELMDSEAALRWISYEPALGMVNWRPFLESGRFRWLVAGGESGADARPPHPAWFQTARDACAASGVSFLFKQWGDYAPGAPLNHRERRGARLVDLQGRVVRWGARGDEFPEEAKIGDDWLAMRRRGKKLAGRKLRGVLHDDMPTPDLIQRNSRMLLRG